MPDEKVLVMITVPSPEVGEQVAQMLVGRRLAAGVNILPAVQSIYHWDGQVRQATEQLLIAKTRLAVFQDQLVPAVQELHPYIVPQIIALPIRSGLASYLEWIEQETQ